MDPALCSGSSSLLPIEVFSCTWAEPSFISQRQKQAGKPQGIWQRKMKSFYICGSVTQIGITQRRMLATLFGSFCASGVWLLLASWREEVAMYGMPICII